MTGANFLSFFFFEEAKELIFFGNGGVGLARSWSIFCEIQTLAILTYVRLGLAQQERELKQCHSVMSVIRDHRC